MLSGKLVGLVAVERGDLKKLLEWRNNPAMRKYFREYREISMSMQELWYEKKVLGDPATIMFSIKELESGDLAGACGLVYINWVHRHAELSLYIGWNDSYIDDNGYAEETCRLLFDYGFKELNLNKIWTEIYAFDEKKKSLYDRLGFNVDAVLRDNYFCDGTFWDSYIISLLRKEWV